MISQNKLESNCKIISQKPVLNCKKIQTITTNIKLNSLMRMLHSEQKYKDSKNCNLKKTENMLNNSKN